jgi:hypothetical protein
MTARAIASESDRGVGAAVDRQRETGRQQGWRAVCGHEGQGCRSGYGGRQRKYGWKAACDHEGQGVGAAMEADRESRAGKLSVAMRDRGVGAAVEADRERQADSRVKERPCRNCSSYSAEMIQIRDVTLHVSCGEA